LSQPPLKDGGGNCCAAAQTCMIAGLESAWARHGHPAIQWADDVKLSDVEPRFVCKACAKRGADVRPHFEPARMGTQPVLASRLSAFPRIGPGLATRFEANVRDSRSRFHSALIT